jgi:hypothetical protein
VVWLRWAVGGAGGAVRAARGPARVRSHYRVRNRATEYFSKYGMAWLNGDKK